MRPILFRPPLLFCATSSDFSGFFLVISSNVETLISRRPGEVGLYFFSGMLYPFKYLYLIPGGQGDYGLLPASAVASEARPLAAALAVHVEGVHRQHLHVEGPLDSFFYLYLVGVG